jgi:hypothetical protein
MLLAGRRRRAPLTCAFPAGLLFLEHDPEKWAPGFPRDKRQAFARRSCSNKKIERDGDSKKSHPALGQLSSRQCGVRPSNIVAMTGDRNYGQADADTGAPEILSANSRGSRRATSLKMFWHLGHSYSSISCRFLTGVTPISALSTLHTMQVGPAFMAADPFRRRWFDTQS